MDFQGVDGPCRCELTSYFSDPSLLSVLLFLPLFVVINENYGFKASAKSENLWWFSKTGKNYVPVWAAGKNVTAVGALIQIISWSYFAVKYLLDLTLSSKDGRVVPRYKSDLKVHNLLETRGKQKFREQPAPIEYTDRCT